MITKERLEEKITAAFVENTRIDYASLPEEGQRARDRLVSRLSYIFLNEMSPEWDVSELRREVAALRERLGEADDLIKTLRSEIIRELQSKGGVTLP